MGKGDYHIGDIYQGGYSSLDPEGEGFIGYRIPASKLGMATDPRTANILADVSEKLKTGTKQIEVSSVQPEVFESIPTEQLKEVKRLSKLTGAEVSVHAPLIEPSGITQQGYNELAREQAERQMLSAVERSHQLNPDGNIPVTFHPSVNWQGPEYKKVEGRDEEKIRIPIINLEEGQIKVIKSEERYDVGMTKEELEKGRKISIEKRIDDINRTQWDTELTQLSTIKDRVDRVAAENAPLASKIFNEIREGKISRKDLEPFQLEIIDKFGNASQEMSHIYSNLNTLFQRAYKYGNNEDKKKLASISEEFGENLKKIPQGDLQNMSRSIQHLINQLRTFNPKVCQTLNDFAMENTAKTFGNVAFNSYKKFKDKAPIISVENPPVGGGFSRGEELKNVVEESRKKFVEKAVKEGINKKEAEEQAKKLIGVTWDVGHINMLRKHGYTGKDIAEESKKVAPFVKHVHLSDNFGYEHTELPMGMGNVPVKEILENLGKEGFEAKKVIEAGNWWQHFKSSPFQETLEAFGSPLYSMKMQPHWNQTIGFEQGYFGGYGQMLPQINYETMGAGFSQLPQELGGQRPSSGKGSRVSGRPME